jgi:hypothetical protein
MNQSVHHLGPAVGAHRWPWAAAALPHFSPQSKLISNCKMSNMRIKLPLEDNTSYAGVDEYIVDKILKRRTVRNERQVLVRWRPGWTVYAPGEAFWESEIQV